MVNSFNDDVVNYDNLAAFKAWLLNDDRAGELAKPKEKLDSSVSLKDLFYSDGKAIFRDGAQQKYLETIIYNSFDEKNDKWAKELVEMAQEYPEMVGRIYKRSGNSYDGRVYNGINKAMEDNSFLNNLPVIYAIVSSGYEPFKVGKGGIEDINLKQRQKLNEIINLSEYRNGEKRGDAMDIASDFVREIAFDKLLNYEHTGLRKYIEERFFDGYGWSLNKLDSNLNKLDSKFYNKKILAGILNINRIIHEDTTTAYPPFYGKTMNALMKMVEEMPTNSWENKTLTQKYQELCASLLGKRDWQSISERDEGIIRAGHLLFAQKDILEGRASELDVESLKLVLQRDKTHRYLRQIPEEVMMKPELRAYRRGDLSVTPECLAKDMRNLDVLDSSNLSLKEKEEILSAAENIVADKNPERERLQKELRELNAVKKVIEDKANDLYIKQIIAKELGDLQQAYAKISKNLKNGKANPQEEYLLAENLEVYIAEYLSGNKKALPLPEQKSLPLFGRAEEKQRRENLETSVRGFMKALENLDRSVEKFNILAVYQGKMLDPNSKVKAQSEVEIAQREQVESYKMNRIIYDNIRIITSKLEIMDNDEDRVAKAREFLKGRKAMLRKMAADEVGLSNANVEVVRPDMSPEQKRKTRAKNRSLSSGLEDKAKQIEGMSEQEKVNFSKTRIRNAKINRGM